MAHVGYRAAEWLAGRVQAGTTDRRRGERSDSEGRHAQGRQAERLRGRAGAECKAGGGRCSRQADPDRAGRSGTGENSSRVDVCSCRRWDRVAGRVEQLRDRELGGQ